MELRIWYGMRSKTFQYANECRGHCGWVVSTSACQAGGLWYKSGILPLLKHACGESDWLLCWLYTLAEVSPQRWISGNIYHICLHKVWIRQHPLCFWNPEETSPEVQNRGISGPKNGHVSNKILKKYEWRVWGQVQIQDLVKGGPASEAKSCWHSRAESCEWSELSMARVQTPLKGPGSFWVFDAQIWILPHSRDSFSVIFNIDFNTKSKDVYFQVALVEKWYAEWSEAGKFLNLNY